MTSYPYKFAFKGSLEVGKPQTKKSTMKQIFKIFARTITLKALISMIWSLFDPRDNCIFLSSATFSLC